MAAETKMVHGAINDGSIDRSGNRIVAPMGASPSSGRC